jgi:hypothetical protein
MITEPSVGSTVAIFEAVERHTPAVLDLAQRICTIPAPTFSEERRAAFVKGNSTLRVSMPGSMRRETRAPVAEEQDAACSS